MVTALRKPATFVLPAVKCDLYHGGAWHKARAGPTQETHNPATGESLGAVAWAEAVDVNAAVKAAYAGFKVWRRMKSPERAIIPRKAAEVIRQPCRTASCCATRARRMFSTRPRCRSRSRWPDCPSP